MIDLTRFQGVEPYWYLATCYSKYPDGLEAAFQEAARIAAFFVRQGIPIYSPIAHTHPVALYGGIDPLNHAIWLPADYPMMKTAGGLIVAKMASWEDSYGISQEIKTFNQMGKPIEYLEWPIESETIS